MLYPAELRGRDPAGGTCGADEPPPGVQHAEHRAGETILIGSEPKPVKVLAMSPVESDEEDLTRKQRREQARAQRKAMEEAEAAERGAAQAPDAARDRGGGRGRGDRRDPDRHRRAAQIGPAQIEQAKRTRPSRKSPACSAGIPQSGNALGNPTAPVTLEYFGDLECPICREFTLGALPHDHPEVGAHGQAEDRIPTRWRPPRANRKSSRPSRSQRSRRASRTRCGTSSSPSTTSREKRTAATSPKTTSRASPARCRGSTSRSGPATAATRSWPTRSPPTRRSANNEGFTGTPSFLIGKTGGALSKLEYTGSPTDPTFVNEAIEKLLKG